jgi:1,4-dihydroxy-2-naphthoate octaprenyltransferase
MKNTSAWISAMRLRTLPLSVSGIVIGSASALLFGSWNSFIFVFALLTTILFQILSNLANDLGDTLKGTDNENRIGPERAVQGGKISMAKMKKAILVVALLGLISAGILIAISLPGMNQLTLITYISLALLSTLAAITYTIGKKAYGYHGLGDLMVLIFFGFVSVLGVFTLYTKTFDQLLILPALTVGLLSMAVLNLNNMRDFKNDASSNKITLVVRMGPTRAKFYHALLIFLALMSLAVFIFQLSNPYLFIALAPFMVLIVHLRKVMQTTNPKDFDPELKKVALSTFLIAILFFLATVFAI